MLHVISENQNANTSEPRSLFPSLHSDLPVEGEDPGLCSKAEALDLNQPTSTKGYLSFQTAAIQELLSGLGSQVLGSY